MKNFKKNQILILVIALMLVTAGYLNYTTTGQNTITTTSEGIDYAGIGDAKLVSSNAIENNLQSAVVENNDIQEEVTSSISAVATQSQDNSQNVLNTENTQTTNANSVDDYFSTSRLNRETMYSQMIESYQKILENESIPTDQKTIAQTEIKNINDLKNKIMICENLIKTKGMEDIIIFVNDKSVSAIVKTKELKQEQIAQIQNIITREMNVEIDNIHISSK